MRFTKHASILAASIIALLSLAACGGGGEETAAPAPADDGVLSVRITSNDQMRFSLSEIRAEAGQEVRLTHANIGRMPKETMGHNWVLLRPMSDAEINRFAMNAASNAPDYLPEDQSAIIVMTRMLGPGETETITFNAPEERGTYPFLCTFPGHAALMRGVMIVE